MITLFACSRDSSSRAVAEAAWGSGEAHVQSITTRQAGPHAVWAHDAPYLPFGFALKPSPSAPWARGLLSAFWERGSPDFPACGLRRGSNGGPVRPNFINSSSRPSQGAKPRGADDRKLPQERPPRQAREEAERSRQVVPCEVPMMQAMTTEARRAPGGRWPAQSPCFLFGAKGASAGKSIKQRQPFRCNKTKTSRMAGRRSSWSPSRRHHQSLWQARTDFSQDKCTRCSPSKWPIVGALPTQYLGRGPRPRSINRASHHKRKGPGFNPSQEASPPQELLPARGSSSIVLFIISP